MVDCIFCKIAAGQIPARKVFEDDELMAFHDINPAAPVHLLIVPKTHIETLVDAQPEHEAMLGRMMALAPQLAFDNGARALPEGGLRVIMNVGPDGGQEVYHIHLHVLAGERPWRGFAAGAN
ncbi:MAG: histidine triad nucleotide-binding protein [Formosimonas sp.]